MIERDDAGRGAGSADLTIVIPAYNEEDRIAPFLDSVATYAHRFAGSVEVVVVDDGSTDDTPRILRSSAKDLPDLRIEGWSRNRGKGAAVRHGLSTGRGRRRVFLDADGSTPAEEIDQLLARMDDRDDRIVIGSIAVPGGQVHQSQSHLRQVAGRLGSRLIQAVLLPGVADPQRGCKLLSARACDEILPHCRVDGWGFDVELLAVGRALGYAVVEVPVRWVHREGSKVGPLAYLSVLADVWRARRTVRRLRRGPV